MTNQNPRHDTHEEHAIALLNLVLIMNERNRDALPGSAVKKIKEAVTILKKRRHK